MDDNGTVYKNAQKNTTTVSRPTSEDDIDSEMVDTTSPIDDDYDETNGSYFDTDYDNDYNEKSSIKEPKNSHKTRPKLIDKDDNKVFTEPHRDLGESVCDNHMICSDNPINNINSNANDPNVLLQTRVHSLSFYSKQNGTSRIISRKKRSHRRRFTNSQHPINNDNDHDGDIDRSNDDFDQDEWDENSGNDNEISVNRSGDNISSINCENNGQQNSICTSGNINIKIQKQQDKPNFLLRSRIQAQARNKHYHIDTNRVYNLNLDRSLRGCIASSDRINTGNKCNYTFDKNNTYTNQKSSQSYNIQNNNKRQLKSKTQCNELSIFSKLYLTILNLSQIRSNNNFRVYSNEQQENNFDITEEEGEVTEDNQIDSSDRHSRYNNIGFHKRNNKTSYIHEQVSEFRQTNMPTSSNRYQPLHGVDDLRPARKISSRNKSHRLGGPSGYSRLNHNYRKPRHEQTFCQEFKRLILLIIIVSVCCIILWQIYRILTAEYNWLGFIESQSKLGYYRHYAVSTDAKPCAKVGANLLNKGGSAVDAAVGTLICMGVVLPNSLGIGGGSLMAIYDSKEKKATFIDGREIAPDYATENMYENNTLAASRGPLSIGIPGELAASFKAHQMFGKLNWSDLFNESIVMAEKGAPMVEHLSFALRAPSHSKHIKPELAKIYTNPKTGDYYSEGDIFIQKELANTLKRIRDNGAKEFYGGLTGKLFVEDLQAQGGNITIENLIKYEALVKEPLTFKLESDLNLHTSPLPGSGIVLSVILRIMKEFGYYKEVKPQSTFEGSVLYYHRLAEAFKFAYAQRAGLEDNPDDKNRIEHLIAKLSSEKFIKDVVSKIDDDMTHNDDRYGGNEFFKEDHGTAHVSVVDGDGNAVAITSSVNLYFGSGMVSPRTGITYNDVMDDFVSPNIVNKFGLSPSKFNHIKPGRRPLSSMAPSIFTDSNGNVKLVIGASGGTKITTSIASVSLRNCFIGEDIKTAIDGPRIHHQYLPNQIYHELNFPKDILHSLEGRKHKVVPILDRSSIIMAVAVDNKIENGTLTRYITANSDYRKGGTVEGL